MRNKVKSVTAGVAAGIAVLGVISLVPDPSTSKEHESTRLVHQGQTRCGIERWSVKTLSDPAAKLVDLSHSTSTTVKALANAKAPQLPSDNVTRLVSEERLYTVKAKLTDAKLEDDGDYHLVLESNGSHMIAEIPNFACVANTQSRARIADARAEYNTQIGVPPKSYFVHPDKDVKVTGVLFWDFPHGQRGVAPNAVELHPVISFKVNG